MKIDIFAHILPVKYYRMLTQKAAGGHHLENLNRAIPTISNLEERFRLMDKYEGYTQVLSVGLPPVESIVGPEDAVALARTANDEMADLVARHPQRFAAAIATLPMNDPDSALRELDRALSDLHLKGIQLFTPINDRPLSSPEFLMIYKRMVEYDLPIWIHPHRTHMTTDYASEKVSKYLITALSAGLTRPLRP